MTRWKSARLRGRALLLSARLPNGLRFLQHPLPATPTALLAERPAFHRRDVRLAMFASNDTNELVPAFSTGSRGVRVLCPLKSNRLRRRFWLEPVSVFGSLELTVAAAIHLCWTCHSADSQNRIDALSFEPSSRRTLSPQRGGNRVSAASDPTVTSRAGANRLLRREPQVRLTFFSYRTIIGFTFMSHRGFSTTLRPLARLRFGRNDRFFLMRQS